MNKAGKQNNRSRVLIVSLPGMMQNVLRDTFANRKDVMVVGVASGCLSAVGMIQEQLPDLVVIDSNLPHIETCALISWLKEEHPQINSLVLVETTQQLNKVANAGADVTLRSYSFPESLERALDNLRLNHDNQ